MPESDLVYRDGLRFSCTRCSRCCRHTPGYVFLSARDLEGIAHAVGVGTAEVRRRYCRTVTIGAFPRVSLQEKPNLDCIFWNQEGCSIYDARPLQCRSFPFWSSNLASRESWEEQAAACPGIGRGRRHSQASIRRWLAQRIADPLLGE